MQVGCDANTIERRENSAAQRERAAYGAAYLGVRAAPRRPPPEGATVPPPRSATERTVVAMEVPVKLARVIKCVELSRHALACGAPRGARPEETGAAVGWRRRRLAPGARAARRLPASTRAAPPALRHLRSQGSRPHGVHGQRDAGALSPCAASVARARVAAAPRARRARRRPQRRRRHRPHARAGCRRRGQQERGAVHLSALRLCARRLPPTLYHPSRLPPAAAPRRRRRRRRRPPAGARRVPRRQGPHHRAQRARARAAWRYPDTARVGARGAPLAVAAAARAARTCARARGVRPPAGHDCRRSRAPSFYCRVDLKCRP